MAKPLKYQLKDLGIKFGEKHHKLDLQLRNLLRKRGAESEFDEVIELIQTGQGTGELFYSKLAKFREYSQLSSHDCERILSTHAEALKQLRRHQPKSVLEIGCGAGLMATLTKDNLQIEKYVGVDKLNNLVEIASNFLNSKEFSFFEDDYLKSPKLAAEDFDLILADCAVQESFFDLEQLPHIDEEIEGLNICMNCVKSFQNALKDTFFEYINTFSGSRSKFIFINRLPYTDNYLSFIFAAEQKGWVWDTKESKLLEFVPKYGERQRLGCLVFKKENADSIQPKLTREIIKWLNANKWMT
tara:strand:- start:1586 stop:2485 length:900 start_codon:yes stop_codon:yes gene_type:complete